MFGCTAVCVEEKIVFILRDKRIATTKELHVSLRRELPNLHSITVASESFHQLAGTVAAPPAKRSNARPATPYIAFTSVPPNDSPKRVLIRLTFD